MRRSTRALYDPLLLQLPTSETAADMDEASPGAEYKPHDYYFRSDPIAIELNLQRRTALAEVDNAPFSSVSLIVLEHGERTLMLLQMVAREDPCRHWHWFLHRLVSLL